MSRLEWHTSEVTARQFLEAKLSATLWNLGRRCSIGFGSEESRATVTLQMARAVCALKPFRNLGLSEPALTGRGLRSTLESEVGRNAEGAEQIPDVKKLRFSDMFHLFSVLMSQ